jgi:hypothetical protein
MVGPAAPTRSSWLLRRLDCPLDPAGPLLLAGAAVAAVGLALVMTALASSFSPVVTAIGAIGAIVAAWMFLSPNVALLILCASLPFERIGRLTNDADQIAVSASRLLGLLALASLLLHMFIKKERLRFGLPVWLYGGYTVIALLSYVWADSPQDTFRDSLRIVGNLLFFFLIINAVRTFSLAKAAVLVWLVASLGAGAFSLSDYFLFSRGGTVDETQMGLTSERRATVLEDGAEARTLGMNVRRLFGTTAHPTLFGLNMLMTVPFLLWVQRTRRGAWQGLWPVGLVVAALAIVLSNTRAVFLVSVLAVAICVWRRLWRPNLQAILAFVAIVLVAVPFIPEDVWRRTLDPSLYTVSKADGLRVRLKYWGKSWEIIQDNWLHGIGVGNQTRVVEMITDEATGNLTPLGLRASAHNEYISVMSEVGIFGYLFHWGFVGLVTAAGFRAAARFRRLRLHDEYVFCLACQVITLIILIFAVQSEVFHYPLKAWWMTAALGPVMLDLARRHEQAARLTEAPA